jgi:hypothetical protein
MSKKINKTMQRKIAAQTAMEKRRAKKYGYSTANLLLEDDYYATADHLSYEDLNELLALPQRISGKL